MKTLNYPVTDSHVHMYTDKCIPYFRSYMDKYNLDAVNIACLCNLNQSMEHDAAQNILAAISKLTDSRFYAHGGLVYEHFPVTAVPTGRFDFAAQAQELIEMGFDGIKMLESKPTTRKLTSLSPASEWYDGFYSYLEKNRVPLVAHVADPETFWRAETAPEFSFKEGWFYGDGTFLTKEELYYEVRDILLRHPNLCVTFAHYFFLSYFPGEDKKLLDKYPDVMLDITPGREMFDGFTKNYDYYRDFFEKYSPRIMFGTDMTSDEFQGAPGEMIQNMKRFLSTDDEFHYWDYDLKGLNLSARAVDDICRDNFRRRVSAFPKPVNTSLLNDYILRYLPYVKDEGTRKFIADFAKKEL